MSEIPDLAQAQLSRYHSTKSREEVEINISRDENLMLIEIDCLNVHSKRMYKKAGGKWIKGKVMLRRQDDATLIVPGVSEYISERLLLPSKYDRLLS